MIPVLFPINDTRYPDHKTFIVRTTQSYFDTISNFPTKIERIIYTTSLFKFMIRHFRFISSPEFGSIDGRKRMIHSMLERCNVFLSDKSILSDSSENKMLYTQFLRTTRQLASKCKVCLENKIYKL